MISWLRQAVLGATDDRGPEVDDTSPSGPVRDCFDFDDLPEELRLHVLSFCDIETLGRYAQASRTARRIALDRTLPLATATFDGWAKRARTVHELSTLAVHHSGVWQGTSHLRPRFRSNPPVGITESFLIACGLRSPVGRACLEVAGKSGAAVRELDVEIGPEGLDAPLAQQLLGALQLKRLILRSAGDHVLSLRPGIEDLDLDVPEGMSRRLLESPETLKRVRRLTLRAPTPYPLVLELRAACPALVSISVVVKGLSTAKAFDLSGLKHAEISCVPLPEDGAQLAFTGDCANLETLVLAAPAATASLNAVLSGGRCKRLEMDHYADAFLPLLPSSLRTLQVTSAGETSPRLMHDQCILRDLRRCTIRGKGVPKDTGGALVARAPGIEELDLPHELEAPAAYPETLQVLRLSLIGELADFIPRLPKTTAILEISGGFHMTYADLATLAVRCPSLRSLELRSSKIGGEPQPFRLPELRTLVLTGAPLPPVFFERGDFPHLEALTIVADASNQETLKAVGALETLRALNVSGLVGALSGDVLRRLTSLTCPLSADLPPTEGCPALRAIEFTGPLASQETATTQLGKLSPLPHLRQLTSPATPSMEEARTILTCAPRLAILVARDGGRPKGFGFRTTPSAT